MADLWRTISERHGELLSALGQHIEISLIALMIATTPFTVISINTI
ncbi:hypothetical protein [Lacticaseibacillus paracasei]